MSAELLESAHLEEGPSIRDEEGFNEEEDPHVSLSLAASSDLVKALFGDEEVGSSWGDFFCTLNRIRGRIFASSRAVLFYSNLLGFERRLCIRYRDIVEMELYRTTSIRIVSIDGESTIFKSFHHRKHVLQLLQGLKILAEKQRERSLNTSGLRHENASTEERLALRTSLVSSPSLTLPSSPVPMPTNRRRAVSDSVLRLPMVESHVSLVDHPEVAGSLSGADSFLGETDFVLKEAWEEAKKPRTPPLQQIGVESVSLSCSLDEFFQHFLADNAPFSLDRYQRNYIKDRDVEVSKWETVGNDTYNRTVTFTHPIKNAMGLGPSAAHTKRRQQLRRFPGYGISLENTTNIEGIPSADAFSVNDHWVIEVESAFLVNLHVRFDTRFTKIALFKAIIEKNVRKETKDWFAGYGKMLQDALAEKTSIASIPPPTEVLVQDDTFVALQAIHATLTSYAQIVVAVLSILLLVMLLQLLSMREAVALLREQAAVRPDVRNAQLANEL